MSRVYPSIQGCTFRKVVERQYVCKGLYIEILSCGHTHNAYDGTSGSKRRCYSCKWEKEHREKP